MLFVPLSPKDVPAKIRARNARVTSETRVKFRNRPLKIDKITISKGDSMKQSDRQTEIARNAPIARDASIKLTLFKILSPGFVFYGC